MATSQQEDRSAVAALLIAGGVEDPDEVAGRLLDVAGDPRRLLSTAQAMCDPANERALALIRASAVLLGLALRRDVESRPVLSTRQAVLDHLHFKMGGLPDECLRVLYLDTRLRLLSDDVMVQGTLDSVGLHPRRLLQRALELNAAAMIVVHNHPSGVAEPSSADCKATIDLVIAARTLHIEILDHLVIAAGGHVSMRDRGML